MSVNMKEKEFDFSIADMNHNDESAYSPTIRELTPKQLQNLRIKKSPKSFAGGPGRKTGRCKADYFKMGAW